MTDQTSIPSPDSPLTGDHPGFAEARAAAAPSPMAAAPQGLARRGLADIAAAEDQQVGGGGAFGGGVGHGAAMPHAGLQSKRISVRRAAAAP